MKPPAARANLLHYASRDDNRLASGMTRYGKRLAPGDHPVTVAGANRLDHPAATNACVYRIASRAVLPVMLRRSRRIAASALRKSGLARDDDRVRRDGRVGFHSTCHGRSEPFEGALDPDQPVAGSAHGVRLRDQALPAEALSTSKMTYLMVIPGSQQDPHHPLSGGKSGRTIALERSNAAHAISSTFV